MTNPWEYGIAIGILALLVPTFTGIIWWVVKRSIDNSVKAASDMVETQKLIANNLATTQAAQFSSQTALLQEHDRNTLASNEKLVDAVHDLNTHLAELTGMLTFILDHYIKTGTGEKK